MTRRVGCDRDRSGGPGRGGTGFRFFAVADRQVAERWTGCLWILVGQTGLAVVRLGTRQVVAGLGIRWDGSVADRWRWDGRCGRREGRGQDDAKRDGSQARMGGEKRKTVCFPGGGRGAEMGFICQAGRLALAKETSYFPSSPCFLGELLETQPRRARCPVALRGMRQPGRLRSSSRSAAHRRNRGRAQTHQSSSSSPTREGRWMVWTLRRPIRLFTRACFQSHSPTVPPELGLCRFAALNQLLSHNWLLEGTACFKT